MNEIVNRVGNSSLLQIDLTDFLHQGDIVIFDVAMALHEGIILKEKQFRQFLKEHPWEKYQDKNVGIICSQDAIVATWAFMLLTSKMVPFANLVIKGDEEAVERAIIDQAVDRCINILEPSAKKVTIKGCGQVKDKEYAFSTLTARLMPQVDSIMYGEPCSAVPIFKRNKK